LDAQFAIWRVGEETGELDNAAERLADSTADRAELMFTELSQWLPRVVYLLVCLLMVKFILSGYASIINSYSNIK